MEGEKRERERREEEEREATRSRYLAHYSDGKLSRNLTRMLMWDVFNQPA